MMNINLTRNHKLPISIELKEVHAIGQFAGVDLYTFRLVA